MAKKKEKLVLHYYNAGLTVDDRLDILTGLIHCLQTSRDSVNDDEKKHIRDYSADLIFDDIIDRSIIGRLSHCNV